MKNTQVQTSEFKGLIKKFGKILDSEGKSETYTSQHVNCIKEFLSFVEDREVISIKKILPEHVNAFLEYTEKRPNTRRGGTLSDMTVNKYKGSLTRFWQFLEMEKYEVHAINIRFKKRTLKVPPVYSVNEIEKLYSVTDNSAVGYRDRAMLALYYGCGLRKGEGLKLNVGDLDFTKGRAKILDPKNGRDRYVMFSPKVQQMIEEYVYQARDMYLAEGSPYQNLFIGERGKPVKGESIKARMNSLALRVKEKYGTEKTLNGIHALRHSLGTHLYMAGMSVDKIALLLGHSSLDTTQLYIHSATLLKNESK